MATTEAHRGRLRVVVSNDLVGRGSSALAQPFASVAPRAVASELLALATLLAALVAVYWPLLAGVGIYAESDTFTFFYPVYAVLHEALRAGELPLWTPYVFGGFPLFAEGQIGALYPPSIVAAALFSPVEGFLLLRVFHVGVAMLGAYALARAHRVGRCGAVIAGLTFGLGSFVVAQQHHANLLAAAVWLPLLLALIEVALARQGWVGHGLLGLAALVLGLEALATHVQPLMLTGALLVAYVLVRQTWMAIWEMHAGGLRRGAPIALLLLVDALGTVVFVAAVGALIAAAQILPLYELSQESWRAGGWTYNDAIEYSLPPVNLITLIFPFFFRTPDGGQWSLWQIWESVLYVGIVPLLLAVVAVLGVRRWAVTFFALATGVSVVIALGGYAPYGLYEQLWLLPGMNVQRAPARFTLIAVLSLAMLAAFGADWLAARRDERGVARWRTQLIGLHVGVLALLGLVLGHLVVWRAWIQADRPWAMQLLGKTYLAQTQDPLQMLLPLDVVRGLENALSLANPKTAVPLVLLGLFALLLVAWRELRRLAPLWQAALVLLVAIDLALFASDFHPLVDISYLGEPGPAGRALIERDGPWRMLTRPDVQEPQPNELLPHDIAEAGGYSPLQLARHRWYAQSVQTVDDVLLDLWSVRWIVEPARPESLPSYQMVSFHPSRPLMIGGVGTPNGQITLRPEPETTTSLRLISALNGGETIPDGEQVGEWLLTDTEGVRYVLPIRAGREIAEWRPRAPGRVVQHRPIQKAAAIGDVGAQSILGYAEISLPRRVTISELEYRHTNPLGQTVLYGVALHDREEDATAQVGREDRLKLVYSDPAVNIFENERAYPRAFVVPEAVLAPDGAAAMARLRNGPLDPRRQVVVESQPSVGIGPFVGTPPVEAVILAESGSVIDIQADAPAGGFLVLTDPFYPGWRAYLDGEEQPILRADFLFRAVGLPPGQHAVRFVFVPPSLERGISLSLVGLGLAASAAVIGLGMPLLLGAIRRARRPAVTPTAG
ncbi:MAG: YfhO family protein [Chloroflexi bacterium]|nr:YfhO family protein [Chloroflexota bacterium]